MAWARLTAITDTQALYNTGASSLADSVNSYDLTGASAVYENGFEGSTNTAFDFDASWYAYRAQDYNISASQDFTIQFAVKIETAPGSGVTFSFFNFATNDAANSRANCLAKYVNTAGVFSLKCRDTGGNVGTSNQTLTEGTWYLISFVEDRTNSLMKLYVGATEVISTATSAGNSGMDKGLAIGGDIDNSGTFPPSPGPQNKGDFAIDNFRVLKAARTGAEVAADAAELASGPAGLKTWDGVAKASIKTVNGVAIASVKTWNGVV